MHDRYAFVCEVLGIAVAILDSRAVPLAVAEVAVALCVYGRFLFGADIPLAPLLAVNLAVYLGYVFLMVKALKASAPPDLPPVQMEAKA